MDLKKKRSPHPPKGKADTPRFLLNPNKGNIIGITGSIASGKTFVLECFKKLGFAVFNADEAVHQLLTREGKAFDLVAKLCPESVTEQGIDRQILGANVFSIPEKLKQLEAILHPLVRDAQVQFMVNIKKTSGKSMVFEVPLLFENNREKFYDHVVVTIAPKPIQKERALLRKNMTEEKFDAIISKQLSDAIKIKKADFVIKTGRTPEDTFKQVRSLVYHAGNQRNRPRHRDDRAYKKRPAN